MPLPSDETDRHDAADELARLGWTPGPCWESTDPEGRAFHVGATRDGVSLQATGADPGQAWGDLIALIRDEVRWPQPSGPSSPIVGDDGAGGVASIYRIAYDRASSTMNAARPEKIGRLDPIAMARILGVDHEDGVDLIRQAIEDAEIGRPPRR